MPETLAVQTMMPGQKPYTQAELKALYALVADAAAGDPGEQDEPGLLIFASPTGCICGMPDWDTATLTGGDCRSIGCDPRCPSCSYVDDCSATGYPAGSSERERCQEPAVVCVPDDSSDSGDREGYCADHAVTHLSGHEDTGRWDG